MSHIDLDATVPIERMHIDKLRKGRCGKDPGAHNSKTADLHKKAAPLAEQILEGCATHAPGCYDVATYPPHAREVVVRKYVVRQLHSGRLGVEAPEDETS